MGGEAGLRGLEHRGSTVDAVAVVAGRRAGGVTMSQRSPFGILWLLFRLHLLARRDVLTSILNRTLRIGAITKPSP